MFLKIQIYFFSCGLNASSAIATSTPACGTKGARIVGRTEFRKSDTATPPPRFATIVQHRPHAIIEIISAARLEALPFVCFCARLARGSHRSGGAHHTRGTDLACSLARLQDVPNGALRHITLPNNENKPVTNSRDTQEVPQPQAQPTLDIIRAYRHKTSILDDFEYFDEEEDKRKTAPAAPAAAAAAPAAAGAGAAGAAAAASAPAASAASSAPSGDAASGAGAKKDKRSWADVTDDTEAEAEADA